MIDTEFWQIKEKDTLTISQPVSPKDMEQKQPVII
jgi:hypothetical protein